MKRVTIGLVLGVLTALALAAGSQLTGGPGLTRVVLDPAASNIATGSGTSANPLKVAITTGGGLTGTGSAGSPLVSPTLLTGGGQFGDGSDGAASLSGANTISRDQFYTTLTLAAGTTMTCTSGRQSCRIFASVAIVVTSGTATISTPGLAASGNTAGAGLTGGPVGGVSGAGAGGIQNAGQIAGAFSGTWPTSFRAGAGGTGGTGTGGVGGAGSIANSLLPDDVGGVNTWSQASLGAITMGNPGRLGGGGGGGSAGGTTGICSGGGGGGGGGVIIVGMRSLSGAGALVVTAPGGAGGNTTGGAGCNGGGGGGGGGGYAIVGYGGASIPGALTVSAPGGVAGAGQGTGTSGSAGSAGKTLLFPLGPS